MADDQDAKLARVRDIFALLSVHFKDVVVIARLDSGFASKYSDPTWAVGACERLKASIIDESLLDEIDKRESAEE